ncbi:MAG: peptidase S16 [Streptosporangiales bacterium]|nr:peptidase S16 [Streptosporangiales bacterium]
MSEKLALFPLGTVLFPGLVLPLHVFEERYRALVGHLLEHPEEERRFGVVAITLGHEVGAGAVQEMADVGCTAELREVQRYDDGRFDIVVVGGQRFRIDALEDADAQEDPFPYPRADVTVLPEEAGADTDVLTGWVDVLFRGYRVVLRGHGIALHEVPDPPEDPVRLSYLVAASLILDRREKQELLEAADAAARLRREVRLLRREISLLRLMPAVPATPEKGVSPN